MASLFGGFTFQSRVLLRFVTCPTSRGVLSNRTNSTGHYSWIKGGGERYPLKDNEDKENGAKKRLLDIAALMVPTTVQHIFRLLLRKSRSETDFLDAIACFLYSGGRGQGVLGVCLCVFVYFIHLFVFIFFSPPLFGEPLRTRVVMTFLLTHLHSPHFVFYLSVLSFIFCFLLCWENERKNGFKRRNCLLWGRDLCAPSTLK